jgi:hypothetical protein
LGLDEVLHGVNFLHYLEELVVANLEVALVADLLLLLVCFRQATFVLPAAVTDGAGAAAAVVAAFLHDASELTGKCLVA